MFTGAAESVIAGPTAVLLVPNTVAAANRGLVLVTAGDVASTVITKTLKKEGKCHTFYKNKQPIYSKVGLSENLGTF